MQQAEEMIKLNSRLTDLKNLFKVGEKIIPGIQKLIDFMAEIVPLLNNINSSIEESTKKIPKATTHLLDVTSANEIATTEILDKVDEITKEVEMSEKVHKNFSDKYAKIHDLIAQLKLAVPGNDPALELLNQIDDLNGNVESLNTIQTSIDKIKEHLQNITITLQVQDITAQQLSAVNHLIISVQKKLSSLVLDLSGDNTQVFDGSQSEYTPDATNFDPDASFLKNNGAQSLVDDLISKTTSQDEIDKLFNANGK